VIFPHSDLVEIAEKWLLKRCGFAFTELSTHAQEIPDAIGFKSGISILIECKTSRADFLADRKKALEKTRPRALACIGFTYVRKT
jgi:Holliday junction resolvase